MGAGMTDLKTDAEVDRRAAAEYFTEYGGRAAMLPPVAIVIAAYNEQDVIASVLRSLPATVRGLGTAVIVVSDGSADRTGEVARTCGALVCDLGQNRGQGAALRLGYRLARQGGAEFIVTTDADGQYSPADIEHVLAPILDGVADFVTGSRALGGEETTDPVRRIGVRVFGFLITLLTGQRVTDPAFGLRAMRARVTGAVRLEQTQYQSSELLIAVLAHGFRVREVPATIGQRQAGSSKKGRNAFYGVSFARVIARTWWREWRGRGHPSEGHTRRGRHRKARPVVGKRFRRFVLAAAAAFTASQVTLTICLGPLRWTAGASALIAWLMGAATSYLVSRWAWERKGRPQLLRETLPFWIVALGTAVVLTLATKYANQQAFSMGLSHGQRVLFADGAYFVANIGTFLSRFLIFHYVLFADRKPRRAARPGPAGEALLTGPDGYPHLEATPAGNGGAELPVRYLGRSSSAHTYMNSDKDEELFA